MKIYYFFYKKTSKNFLKKKKLYLFYNNDSELKNFIIDSNQYFIKGLNLFFFRGRKLSLYSKFNVYFKSFYSIIYKNKNMIHYSYFNEIKSSIKDNLFLNNPINLFKWYMNYFSFMFNFKNSIKKKKKLSKFDNDSKSLKIVFVSEKKRNIIFFKWLKRLFLLNYSTNFFSTFNFLLNDIFFNFKNSNLYKYKVKFYKNLLSN